MENILLTKKNLLVYIDSLPHEPKYISYLKNIFCGTVICGEDNFKTNYKYIPNRLVYVCGDISKVQTLLNEPFIVIRELSHKYINSMYIVDYGQIPLNIHNVGLFIKRFYNPTINYFTNISHEHHFQELTESNKPNKAFRTGIYLSKVDKTNDGTEFNLLRCSTNFNGPTDNFHDTDNYIISNLNKLASQYFSEPTTFNHVLAQIYNNKIMNYNDKIVERKAKIKAHSDKTKDMPREGLIAFCSFYEDYINGSFAATHIKKSKEDPFDYVYNNKTSVLTRLCFKLKNTVNEPTLINKFTITLYPNSVFIIPLSTNRLYTHEIVPSTLPIDKLPIRMGYIVRCSKTKAVYKDGKVYIKDGNNILLKKMNPQDADKLKQKYLEENISSDIINYEEFYFSMNDGDYIEPLY